MLIEEGGVERRLARDDFPLALGGAESGVRLPGLETGAARAYLGVSGDEIFVQPAEDGQPVVCNGAALRSSQWLREGDVVDLGGAMLRVASDGGSIRLEVEARLRDAGGGRPPKSAEPAGPRLEEPEIRIRPVRFEPSRLAAPKRRRRLPALATVGLWLFLAAFAGAAWFVFTARPVRVEVSPEPDLLEIEGAWLPPLGGRHLLRQGDYTVVAEKEGYSRLEARFTVTGASSQEARFELEPLPASLSITVEPGGVEARVRVDGVDVGVAPVVAPLDAGAHAVEVIADGFQPFEEQVTIGEPGSSVELHAVLIDDRAPITFTSEPAGVAVVVDGTRLGATPLTVPVAAGARRVEWLRAGFRPARTRFEVEAGVAQSVAAPSLVPADGNLVVTSEPEGAAVTVDGVFRGRTPLELDLGPGEPHRVALSKAGYQSAEREVRLEPAASETIRVELVEEVAELVVTSRPPGAEVMIAGQSRGTTTTEGLRVVLAGSEPYEVEVRKEGYVTERASVTPRPGLEQSLDVSLRTPEEERAERTPPVIRTAAGQEMRLIPGGRLRMGAPRREPGRRPNEIERDVELTRPFYISVTEVTNAEFLQFDPTHLSGKAGSNTLELDEQPVVKVSWAAAARYCNWLSDKDSLPPAYRLRGGELVAVEPMNTGYRLPTEAEWEWVARYPEPPTPRKYAWGASLPIPPLAGNFGDMTAASILGRALPGYNDKQPVTAPVRSFAPNPLGLYHLGGNVAEWAHDRYAVDARGEAVPERDPLGPDAGDQHVIRGAGWSTVNLTELRLSYRDAGRAGRADVGFRIVRYAE